MKKFKIILGLLVFSAIFSVSSFASEPMIQFVKKTETGKEFRVFIDEGIKMPNKYRELISFLEYVKEGDVVVFKMLTYGGVAKSGFYIHNAILKCKAKTIADIYYAMSAGSDIALACEEIIINKYAVMLFHGSQLGLMGGGSMVKVAKDLSDAAKADNETNKRLYSNFLPKKYLEKVLNGEDVIIHEEELREIVKKWKPVNVKERDYDKLKKENKSTKKIEKAKNDLENTLKMLDQLLK